jgi:hypothetical protein
MPKETPSQRKTVDRVMHEYAHAELKSGPGGKAGKVKSRKQAIAIALSEAGESKTKSKSENAKSRRTTKAKEAKGKTAMQEKEGKRAKTRTELYEMAKRRDIPGRSKMDRDELQRALRHH